MTDQPKEDAQSGGGRGTVRMTVDVPRELHHRMKILAVHQKTTIRAMFLAAVERLVSEGHSDPDRDGGP